ncbi:MAG: asparaginase [Clostridia bacterium]|nr:asparaginase [Clostridia bacterium]
MKKILLITTGGTLACGETENGLAPSLTAEEILSYIPKAEGICHIETLFVSNIDSTNVTISHWRKTVKAIEENYDEFDGFVITHGTDTLAYTASALSYMIQNSPKPIVLTGSQKPITEKDTDAKKNLLDSFIYVSADDSYGVSVVFGGKVIVGTRARKERSKSFNAFSSTNYPYKATIENGEIKRIFTEIKPQGEIEFFYNMSDSICTLKFTPNMKPEILSYLFKNYDCLIFESFGVGGIPEYLLETFYEEMQKPSEKIKCVVITTQIANEGSDMEIYAVGKKVKEEFKLIETYDMNFEAAYTKLMWILGSGETDYEKIREKFYSPINYDIMK